MPARDPNETRFFELLLDHLCVAGFDGYWKRLNPAWTRTLGFSAEELMSRPLIEFVHPDDREATLAARGRLKDGDPLWSLRNRYRCKDGSYRWFEWRSVADQENELVYAVARDVTELHDMQRQLLRADRMASLGTLAAGAAHEINNPLAYVMANVDMLLADLDSVDAPALSARIVEWREMATAAREGADRIRKIVRGLKTFARSAEAPPAALDVKSVLEPAIEMALNEIRHQGRLTKNYGPTPLVFADHGSLNQVFVNLLLNAVHAVGESPSGENEIQVATSTDEAGHAVVEVRDTGPGIPAALLERIFDPFFTTKPVGVGTGLGLSICHNIVAGLGGEIMAGNRDDGGAFFRVTLPPAPPATGAEPSAAASPDDEAPLRVLVIDDEPAIAAVIRRILRGHDVTAAGSGQEALAFIDAGRSFDVILSDLMMPEMSGMQLYDELGRRGERWPERVVFITAGAFTADARAFLGRVSNERLEKPFDPAVLRALVSRLGSVRG